MSLRVVYESSQVQAEGFVLVEYELKGALEHLEVPYA